MNKRELTGIILLILAGGSAQVFAQDRAGIDRPIRVGMFKGTGPANRYWHTNIHTSHTVIRTILANPAAAGLGDSLITPPAGFTFYSMPVALDSTGNECAGNGCGPTFAQIGEFVAALDTLDVMVMNSVTDFGSRVINAAHRSAIANFWTYKNYVAIHWMTDQPGTWSSMDTIHGARFRYHPPEQSGTVRRDSAFEHEPSWQYLNRGVFSNGVDTSLYDEWMYFTTSGATIRSNAYIRPTMKLDEASITELGQTNVTPMGDHPISWYKQLPTGGRFFYTALGHRADVWTGARTFRRQVYNAILWAAKYDSIATVSTSPATPTKPARGFANITINGSVLIVSGLPEGPYTLEVLSPNGQRVASHSGTRGTDHSFTNLRPGLHIISVTTPQGRHLQRAVIP